MEGKAALLGKGLHSVRQTRTLHPAIAQHSYIFVMQYVGPGTNGNNSQAKIVVCVVLYYRSTYFIPY